MKDVQQRFDDAAALALARRGRLRERLGLTRERLAPMRIAEDAREAVEDGAKSTLDEVRAHPVKTGLTVGALLIWAFRDPLLRHAPRQMRRLYNRLAGYGPDGTDNDTPPNNQE